MVQKPLILISVLVLLISLDAATAQEPIYREPLWTYEIRRDYFGSPSISASSNGSRIALGVSVINESADKWLYFGEVFMFDAKGDLIWKRTVDYGVSIDLSQDGKFMVVGEDRGIQLFDEKGGLLWNFTEVMYNSVSISQDGSYIAAGGRLIRDDYHSISLYGREGDLIWRFEVKNDVIASISTSSDGAYVAAAGRRTLFLLDKKGNLTLKFSFEKRIKPAPFPNEVRISSDGKYVALGAPEGLFFFDRNGLLWHFGQMISSVSISSDGTYIAAADEHRFYLLNKNGSVLWKQERRYDRWPVDVEISPNGMYIAAAEVNYDFSSIYLFSRQGRLLWSDENISVGHLPIISLDFSKDGEYLTVGIASAEGVGMIMLYSNKGFEIEPTSPPSTEQPPVFGKAYLLIIFLVLAAVCALLVKRRN